MLITQRIFSHFNSIKVQLKLAAYPPPPSGSIVFQFHKGTIKTMYLVKLHLIHD